MSLRKLVLACTVVMFMAGAAMKADMIDFTCDLSQTELCTGSISESGGNYSTTGIDVYNDSGPYNSTVPFILEFNTATGKISIDGTDADAGQNLSGEITGFDGTNGLSTTAFEFNVTWSTLPKVAQEWLGSKTGLDSGFVITTSVVKPDKPGKAGSSDVLITSSVPEPGSILLLGSGLLVFGGVLRRKLSGKQA